MGCWRPWEEEEEEVYGWDPGRVFINRGASALWCLRLGDGHYRRPTYDADNGVPRLPKSPRFPAFPTICRGNAATGGSFIHSSIPRLRPSVPPSHGDAHLDAESDPVGCDSVEPPDAAQTASSWQLQRALECVCVRVGE